MVLQWPHHGAKNFTNAFLPDIDSAKFSLVNSTTAPEDAALPTERMATTKDENFISILSTNSIF